MPTRVTPVEREEPANYNETAGLYTYGDESDGDRAAGDARQYVNWLVSEGRSEEAAQFVARLPEDQQADVYGYLDSTGAAENTVNDLQAYVQRERQEAFKRGEILPGVNKAGGGTGLERDVIQGILASNATEEAEGLQDNQPGMDAYQEDAVLDQGPGYSLLDRIRGEGALYSEDVEAFDPTLEDTLTLERTDETGRDAQLRTLGEYDDIIASEGLTATDRARVERLRQDTARRARSQEEAIKADAAEQGRGSGNLSFLMRNQAQQAATNERALGDMETAAIGLERKDSAIQNRGFVGRDIQDADDLIDSTNHSNSQQVLDRNANRENKAGFAKWEEDINSAKDNVDTTQGAIGVEFDNDTARSDKNADREYGANTANDAGERARYADMWSSFGNKYGVTRTGPAFENVSASGGSPGSNGLAEAGSGAIGGAALGSQIMPGYGTVIGAGVGAATGFLTGKSKRTRSTTAW